LAGLGLESITALRGGHPVVGGCAAGRCRLPVWVPSRRGRRLASITAAPRSDAVKWAKSAFIRSGPANFTVRRRFASPGSRVLNERVKTSERVIWGNRPHGARPDNKLKTASNSTSKGAVAFANYRLTPSGSHKPIPRQPALPSGRGTRVGTGQGCAGADPG